MAVQVDGGSRPSGAEVVFVHLGSDAPSYLDVAVAQAQLFTDRVTVVVDRPDYLGKRLTGANRVDAESLLDEEERSAFVRASALDGVFRAGFWVLSALRLVVLGRYAASRPWPVLHLESDVLLYVAPSELLRGTVGRDLWMPVVSGRSASAAILMVRRPEGGSLLAEWIQASAATPDRSGLTEMECLAHLGVTYRDAVGFLPRLPSDVAFDPAFRCLPLGWGLADLARGDAALSWAFDAGCFGQYLGGVDPRNIDQVAPRPAAYASPIRFVNGDDLIDTSRLEFGLLEVNGSVGPGLACGDTAVPLANLHVHSKYLHYFAAPAVGTAWRADRARPRRLAGGGEAAWLVPQEKWSLLGAFLARVVGPVLSPTPRMHAALRGWAGGPASRRIGFRRG